MAIKKINIAIAGATGFVGLDLVKILSKHPNVNITNLCATKNHLILEHTKMFINNLIISRRAYRDLAQEL